MSDIITMGDRRNSGFCLMCGTNLIQPWNDYQCCPVCTRTIVENLQAFESKRKRQKTVGMRPVKSHQIKRQAVPIGVPIE